MVTPPPAAVTVMVEVPAAAVEAATSVKVLLPAPGEAMLVGAKVAVTPAGTPVTDRATAELNPFTRAVVKVMGIDPPGVRLALVALDDSVKLAGGRTARVTISVCVILPLVPVTVKAEVPAAVPEATASVKVLLFPDVTLVGAKLPVTPVGSPRTAKATAELNPFSLAMVSVMLVEPPAGALACVGLAVSVNVAATTVRLTTTVRVNPPPVPVTVIG